MTVTTIAAFTLGAGLGWFVMVAWVAWRYPARDDGVWRLRRKMQVARADRYRRQLDWTAEQRAVDRALLRAVTGCRDVPPDRPGSGPQRRSQPRRTGGVA